MTEELSTKYTRLASVDKSIEKKRVVKARVAGRMKFTPGASKVKVVCDVDRLSHNNKISPDSSPSLTIMFPHSDVCYPTLYFLVFYRLFCFCQLTRYRGFWWSWVH